MEILTTAQFNHPIISPIQKVKYVLYARKSTESEERQVLSIDSQVKEMLQLAERDGLEVVEIRRESHSAKESGQRPVYKEILEDIRRGRFNGILTWAPDRLSRNAGDLGSVVDLMDQQLLLQIRTYGQSFQNSPNEKFLLMILCSQAKLENDNKSVNVKRGLRTRCEMGLRPGVAPTGYLNEKRTDRRCQAILDPERATTIKKMFEKVAYEHWSGRKIYNWLRFDLNFRTSNGKKHLSLGNIYKILDNPYYYGVFEYPKKSGNWYTGKHEPLITKELFNLVQEQIKSQFVRVENKEFAFTKMMTCGLCGSGICADEKFKKQKNGNVHRYVYYGCTKARGTDCKCGYIEEKELLKQFENLVEKMDINEIQVKERLKADIEKFSNLQNFLLGTKKRVNISGIDMRGYARYVLKEGSNLEKRELLGCFNGKIILKNKCVYLDNQFNPIKNS
jgi:DNA invertase Pin-like site-specific DNA recombinase